MGAFKNLPGGWESSANPMDKGFQMILAYVHLEYGVERSEQFTMAQRAGRRRYWAMHNLTYHPATCNVLHRNLVGCG